MSTFAGAGPAKWRMLAAKPSSDLETLLALPSVQEQLASFDGDLEADANAAADAIEGAVRQAIDLLPSPYLEAAREQFGFGERELDGTIPKQNDREVNAARRLGRKSHRWYKDPSPEYGGLAPRNYVAALVACALCEIPNPVAHVDGLAPSPPERRATRQVAALTRQPNATRLPPRRLVLMALAAVIVIALVVAVALGAFAGSSKRLGLPAVGSVVNAATGKVSPPSSLPQHPAVTTGQIEGGAEVFMACVEVRTECNFPPPGQPTPIRTGDVLRFRLRLHNPDAQPISELRVTISSEKHGTDAIASAWLESPSLIERYGTLYLTTSLRSSDGKNHRLSYVPGSSELLRRTSGRYELLARLPDGLFGTGGIVLTDVGAPHGCWDCDLAYVRYVAFNMRVT